MLLNAAQVVLTFIVTIVLARTLGPADYGIFAFAMALIALLSLPGEAGLQTLVLRETARGLSVSNPAIVAGVWSWALRLGVGLSASLAAAGAIGALLSGSSSVNAYLLAMLAVPMVVTTRIAAGRLRGYGKAVHAQLPEGLLRPGLFLAGVLLLAPLLVQDLSVDTVMLVQVGAIAATLVIALWMVTVLCPRVRAESASPGNRRAWLSAVLPLALLSGMQAINAQVGIVALGLLSDDAEVGRYRVAEQFSKLIILALAAVQFAVASRFSQLHAQGNREQLQRLVERSALLTSVSSIFVAVLLAAGAPWVIHHLLGEEYSAAYWPLVILCFGYVAGAVFGPVVFLLNMTGHEKSAARSAVIAAFANIVLNIVLDPHYGAVGAALAGGFSFAVWGASAAWVAYTRTGVASAPLAPGRRSSR